MRAPSAADLLTAWERGVRQPAAARALLLLVLACPEMSPQALARLSTGERNSRLLTLREWLFGRTLACLVSCPACGERLEIELQVADLRVASPGDATALQVEWEDYHIRFRVPNSEDALAVLSCPDESDRRYQLICRCVIDARHGEQSIGADTLPATIADIIAQRMAEADPQADLQLAMHCPACRHAWSASFDIAVYLWTEVDVWAHRMLREVHALASVYGWSEGEILDLSAARRQAYLDLIGARDGWLHRK